MLQCDHCLGHCAEAGFGAFIYNIAWSVYDAGRD